MKQKMEAMRSTEAYTSAGLYVLCKAFHALNQVISILVSILLSKSVSVMPKNFANPQHFSPRKFLQSIDKQRKSQQSIGIAGFL